jgi:small subunit ribosomal protein S21
MNQWKTALTKAQNRVDAKVLGHMFLPFSLFRKQFFMSIEVKVRKGEPMERALRRLKKRLDREGIIRDVRANRYFVKPAQVKRRKKKELDFSNMLRVRYSKM